MNKRTKFIVFTLACVALVGASGLLTNNFVNQIHGVNAEDCTHTHVEHYSSVAPTTWSAGYVEHWACCTCHTAWSDEARTTIIGQTYTNRTNIDVAAGFGWMNQWEYKNTTVHYEEDLGIVYKNNVTPHGSGFAYIETGSPVVGDNIYAVNFVVRNDTTAEVLVQFFNRTEATHYTNYILAPGQSQNLFVTSLGYNSVASGDNYGISLACKTTDGSAFNGYITTTAPRYQTVADVQAIIDTIPTADSILSANFFASYLARNDASSRIWDAFGDIPESCKAITSLGGGVLFDPRTDSISGWDYGSAISVPTTEENPEHAHTLLKVQSMAGNGVEFSFKVQNLQLSGTGYIFFKIYNPTNIDGKMTLHLGYDAGWAAGGNHTLHAKQWSSICVNRANLDSSLNMITPIINAQHDATGTEWKISPIVIVEDEVIVWEGKGMTTSSSDWAQQPIVSSDYGFAYSVSAKANDTTIAAVDADADVTGFSYVSFYVYNSTEYSCGMSTWSDGGEWHLLTSALNPGEWTKVTMTAAVWNECTKNRYLQLTDSNENFEILVSSFYAHN